MENLGIWAAKEKKEINEIERMWKQRKIANLSITCFDQECPNSSNLISPNKKK